ncbi:MAG: Lrp/AsnC family transcriptional regulator [Prevotella sp.]|nr:Lrp/AsnC family transcriptional regulator [Prevotella sp.]MCM1075487.1 Lrp/AsnC family transcriptional regulator [Ruminococcus sp.]
MGARVEKSSIPNLDEIDIKILEILQNDARITLKELSAQVNLSSTPCFERWRRLERNGYISRYVTVLDARKVHRGFTVFCSVKLRRLAHDVIEDFISTIKDIPEVSECYHISGKYDYLLKIYAPDMQYYKHFIVNVLGRVPSIGTIDSSFVMDTEKQSYDLLHSSAQVED